MIRAAEPAAGLGNLELFNVRTVHHDIKVLKNFHILDMLVLAPGPKPDRLAGTKLFPHAAAQRGKHRLIFRLKRVAAKQIKPGDKVVIVELSVYPEELLAPVCDVLEANSQVNEAYLQMMIVNDTEKSYLMVLDAPKDTELFKAVIQAAQPYLTQNKMDMRLTIAATPLGQQGVRGSEPFYSRVRGRVYLEDDEED